MLFAPVPPGIDSPGILLIPPRLPTLRVTNPWEHLTVLGFFAWKMKMAKCPSIGSGVSPWFRKHDQTP